MALEGSQATRACETCRERRVKCDRRLPDCERCEKLRQPCSGYRSQRKFFDEGAKVRKKFGHAKSPPHRLSNTSSPMSLPPTPISSISASYASSAPKFLDLARSTEDQPPSSYDSILSDRQGPHRLVQPSGKQSGDSATAAKLVQTQQAFEPEGQTSFAGSDNFFDLDIESYYANGNNACGFIPGVPVILSEASDAEADAALDEELVSGAFTRSTPLSQGPGSSHRAPSSQSAHVVELVMLMRYFVEVLGPCMDLFDLDAYFSRMMAIKSSKNVMLRSAMAAVAAKQMAQSKPYLSGTTVSISKGNLICSDFGLDEADWFYKAASYYDKGISYLRMQLQRWSREQKHLAQQVAADASPLTTVSSTFNVQAPEVRSYKRRRLANSTILDAEMEDLLSAISVFSLYESLGSTQSHSSQHLDGFQSLLNDKIISKTKLAAPPNALIFPVRTATRASFWNYAREELLAAYLDRSATRLDTENLALWRAAGLPLDSQADPNQPADITAQLQHMIERCTEGREDTISHIIIYLALRIVNYINGFGEPTAGAPPASQAEASPANSKTDRSKQWHALRKLIEAWNENLPITFEPYAVVGIAISDTSPTRFSKIFYSVPLCAGGLVLYHFGAILLILNQPVDQSSTSLTDHLKLFRRVSKEADYHSRQICGIALGRPTLAVRKQMLPALYLAGLCFEADEDRHVVIELLKNIEKETGSMVAWYTTNLKAEWGWNGEGIETAPI